MPLFHLSQSPLVVKICKDYDLVARTLAKKDWVYVDVKLVNWSFANFTICVRTCTPLSTIAQKIKEKHGRIAELKLYRFPAHEKYELTDMDATLEDLGVAGGAKTDEERTTILYKFRPGLNGPLLLKEPELMLPGDSTESRRTPGERPKSYSKQHSSY